ncbi:NAD(P)H-dependent oxidoreductase subunit E [Kaustia mangrovi]|uniref:NAD(P)H-dependent oxidoreductase subunit E n=1 Tax=Kaustia mangrovi TaxID=2593653 RepID=A0A7S8HC95_9HYPH|nr:NAD(P)H-dependent oxidoreductase subunit E [Kaustia mangrovi]QPC43229.1 NAD(P)H-dependent oxidoreductase subunit E [Kaustia mangrovi]
MTHADRQPADPIRPGRQFGRRKGRPFPKGRQIDPDALDRIRALLGDRPRDRDLLIEHLHLIQDTAGHISAADLAALAHEMRLPQAEVFEVATFYHHFDVVKEGETPPAPVTIRVCDSLSCALAGSDALIAELRDRAPEDVRVVHAPCMGRCQCAPAAAVGGNYVDAVTADGLLDMAAARDVTPAIPDYQDYAAYRAEGGYGMLEACRAGRWTPDTVADTLLDAGLRGLGGAGFPSGRKWQFVRAEAGPRYLCINADEGEPGTFKDRHYLETRPHRFLEGMLIAAWGVEAEAAYIYLRDEYPAVRRILLDEIARLEAEGLAEPGYIRLRRGAGAYICGEESAMIESIEGKRGLPRHRPPYVAQIGLFDRPTLVHNVETVYWIPAILENGAGWFAGQGKGEAKGLRSYSVSGRVKEPGVKLAPAGISVRELIEEHCGGMAEGHTFKAYLPGGASGGILPASMGDLSLDFGALEKFDSFVGSHAVVVLSDRDDMKAVAVNLLKFFRDESCGQCTPCRVGCEKAVALMQTPEWDVALLEELSRAMMDASICGLGQAAPNPIRSVMTHFPDEID